MTTIRTTSDHPDFKALVTLLDTELAERDGEEHAFYDQFNRIDALTHCIVIYNSSKAVGCGAIKKYDTTTVEVKRMYVLNTQRGKSLASKVLQYLEVWAKELGYTRAILETGIRQSEAIALYEKNNYSCIPNYGQYTSIENSVCFEHILTS